MAEQQQPAIKCAIIVGMREDGNVFLETHGSEQNLITIDGLLDYGKDYVDEQWAIAKAAKLQAAQAEEVIADVVEPKAKRKAPARKKKEATEDAED